MTIGKIVDHYARFIPGLDEQPIIIGHSFGGLFMQLLVTAVSGWPVSASRPLSLAASRSCR
jgi:hypothetical protein